MAELITSYLMPLSAFLLDLTSLTCFSFLCSQLSQGLLSSESATVALWGTGKAVDTVLFPLELWRSEIRFLMQASAPVQSAGTEARGITSKIIEQGQA